MKEKIRRCRVCGCTDSGGDGCLLRTGKPCHWVGEDLCSACLENYNTIMRVKRSGSNNVAAVRVGRHTYRGSSTATELTACERAAEKAAAAVRATAWRVERYQTLSIVAGRAALYLEFSEVEGSK